MLKKTVKYTDYNGTERTEDFYFNLTTAEIYEMDMRTTGGMQATLNKMIAEQDRAALVALFKDFMLTAYGEKSLDGKRFVKSKELADAFTQTEAYSILFTELVTNTDFAVAFINGVIPQTNVTDAAPAPAPADAPAALTATTAAPVATVATSSATDAAITV